MGSMILVQFPAAARKFSVLRNTYTGYEAHLDSYSVSIWWRGGISLPRGEAAVAGSWPFTSH